MYVYLYRCDSTMHDGEHKQNPGVEYCDFIKNKNRGSAGLRTIIIYHISIHFTRLPNDVINIEHQSRLLYESPLK